MPALWDAYLRTHVRIDLPTGPALVTPQDGPVREPWPLASTDPAWIITACNPRSRQLTEQENASRDSALLEELRAAGGRILRATGFDPQDPQWREVGWAVQGDVDVLQLAHHWEQNAVFRWTPRQWSLVGVLLPGRTDRTWSLVQER